MTFDEKFKEAMKSSGVLIKKRPGENFEDVGVMTDGTIAGIYGSLAYALVSLGNQSKESLLGLWCMVNAIRDEIMEDPNDMAIIARFEDEADLKAQEDYEDMERTTWETQDLRTFAEMSEDSEGGLISED